MTRHVTVTAERGTNWWVLEAAEAGSVSQCKRLSQAAEEMREAIAHQFGIPEDSFVIDVVPVLPDTYRAELEAADESRRVAQEANTAAAAHSRAAARALAEAGLSVRDIGTVMEISYQRAAQLVAGWPTHGQPRPEAGRAPQPPHGHGSDQHRGGSTTRRAARPQPAGS